MMLLIGPHFYGDEYGEGRMGAAGKGIGSRGARDVERAGVATPPSSAFPSTPCSLSLSLSQLAVCWAGVATPLRGRPVAATRRPTSVDVGSVQVSNASRSTCAGRRRIGFAVVTGFRWVFFFFFCLFVCFFFCNEPRSNSTRSLWSFVPGSRVVFARFIDIL